jgi:hypothetical protein
MKRNNFAIGRVILMLLVCLMPICMLAQKVNLDTLNIDQHNLYKDKAVTLRNAGMIVTLGGIGVSVAGMIIGETIGEDVGRNIGEYGVPIITISSFILGMSAEAVGVSLWAIGGSRKTKAEFYDDMNLYKAVKMRNTGMIVTLVGVGVTVTGSVIGLSAASNEDPAAAAVALLCGVVGVPCLAVGIPLWAKGAKRKAEVELTLQKFNIVPQGSMAVGLGLTIKF